MRCFGLLSCFLLVAGCIDNAPLNPATFTTNAESHLSRIVLNWTIQAGTSVGGSTFVLKGQYSREFEVSRTDTRIEATSTWVCAADPACELQLSLWSPHGLKETNSTRTGTSPLTTSFDHPEPGTWRTVMWMNAYAAVAVNATGQFVVTVS